jgi:transcriptional regulator with XRE-family HTH domain
MLGDELRKARHKAGMTQEQVAARARISREYVSQLERNRQSPTVDMLLKVCRILGTSAARIISRVEEAGAGDRP